MTNDVIDLIRARQQLVLLPDNDEPPVHQPEILLIGCVDARLNPRSDIGIPDGKALIYRNIAALISGNTEGDYHEHVSEAAALEFAVNVMKVKHIIVMGHTDCGGIKACVSDQHNEHTQAIRQYLMPLGDAREGVVSQGGDFKAQAAAMEQAAVRQSVENLTTYPAVEKAVAENRIQLHGWVINTGTKMIQEMDLKTGEFAPMRKEPSSAKEASAGRSAGR